MRCLARHGRAVPLWLKGVDSQGLRQVAEARVARRLLYPVGRRRFVLDGEPLLTTEYREDGAYADVQPPDDLFAEIGRAVRSHFFTMDVARVQIGEWLL